MTERELDRLAMLIANELLAMHPRAADHPAGEARHRPTWLPTPVRPSPPARSDEPPLWSGAAQQLGDVAPGGSQAPAHRTSTAELTRATRAAAAGKGSAPEVAPVGRTRHARHHGARSLAIDVRIGVSNRHIHLSTDDARRLLGRAEPSRRRDLSQPGQFAAEETVAVVGPKGRMDVVRIVGPARGRTQLELASSDARTLGIAAPVSASGHLEHSAGGATLVGPAGSVELTAGVIIAARHLHLDPADARRWGIRDGDVLDVRCGDGARAATLHGVLARSGAGHATELHLDADEAHALGVRTGDRATILAARVGAAPRRALVTERDVQRIARAGGSIPAAALLTPSARDRARQLGLLEDR